MIHAPPIEHIHLIGIGGSAMTPLAGMLKERGYRVTGSDAGVYPPASVLLESLGIPWKSEFSEDNLKPEPDLVVIGNALSRGNPEVEYVLDRKIPYRSLPEVLKELFLPGHTSIVVSGTHGKTTTTSMLAWIFHVAGRRPNFLVGGVAENFGRSYGLGGGEEFILEGDEYDSAFFDKGPKFLHYRPDELIITSLEFDHADIYPDLAAIELQFRRLVNLVPRRGRVVAWGEAGSVMQSVAGAFCTVETYGLGGGTDWLAGDLELIEGAMQFRVARRGEEMARVRLPLVGRHNVLNALAAIAIARGRGIEREALEQRGRPGALAGTPAVGRFRAALEHTAPQGVRVGAAGSARSRRRCGDRPGQPPALAGRVRAAFTRARRRGAARPGPSGAGLGLGGGDCRVSRGRARARRRFGGDVERKL